MRNWNRRYHELLEDSQIDDSRIAAEVVLFSDKICNDEETVRLHSHIHGMQKILEEKEGVGRKMDFMAQEMNREANTILSKSSDLEVSDIAIGSENGNRKDPRTDSEYRITEAGKFWLRLNQHRIWKCRKFTQDRCGRKSGCCTGKAR